MVHVTRPRAEDRSGSDERYRHVFEDSPSGIWVIDANRRTLEVNATMCGMLGYTAGELGVLTFADVTHPDDLELGLGRTAQLIAGEFPSYADAGG